MADTPLQQAHKRAMALASEVGATSMPGAIGNTSDDAAYNANLSRYGLDPEDVTSFCADGVAAVTEAMHGRGGLAYAIASVIVTTLVTGIEYGRELERGRS